MGVPHVADVELELRVRVALSHVVLLLLVATEDPNLLDARIEQSREHCVPKRSRTTGDQQNSVQDSLQTRAERPWTPDSVLVNKRAPNQGVLLLLRRIVDENCPIRTLEHEETSRGSAHDAATRDQA